MQPEFLRFPVSGIKDVVDVNVFLFECSSLQSAFNDGSSHIAETDHTEFHFLKSPF